MQVSTERLREDLLSNGRFGAVEVDEGYGRTVLTGSDADRRARDYLVERMEDLGMNIRIDAVGNIAGRWVPEDTHPDAAPVVAGSHLDSVPYGGIFDGPLGVYGALEAVRTIIESDIEPTCPLKVVSFTEEEGSRFDVGVLGSSVACNRRSVDEALALEDDDGVTLEEHLDSIGYRGTGRLDATAWDAFFEVHIEQSTYLEKHAIPVGIVTAITGITNCKIEIVGKANHAGTTPMNRRTDALAAASEFILDVEQAAKEIVATDSESAVGTIGKIDVSPNARNVISGRVTIRTDFRDIDATVIEELVDRARKSLARIRSERSVGTDLDPYRTKAPVSMSNRCRDALYSGAKRAGIDTVDMHSGAGHDAMNVAEVTDAALLFVTSRDGISHNPAEWTDWEDCASASQVLAEAIIQLATPDT